ncbi:MAG: molecular chaperone DnaK, partial [Thermus sp.]
LSEAEIDRMVKEAEANAEADRKRRETADLRNSLDTARIQAERVMSEKESTPEAKSRLEAAISKAQTLVGSDSSDADLRTATQELVSALQAYEQGATVGTTGGTGANQGGSNKPDDVIDADFKPAD